MVLVFAYKLVEELLAITINLHHARELQLIEIGSVFKSNYCRKICEFFSKIAKLSHADLRKLKTV